MKLYKNQFIRYILFLFFLLHVNFLFAQNNIDTFTFSTDKQTKIAINEIKTILLKFENNSNDTINATIKLPLDLGLNFYTNEVLTIKVNPHKKYFIPLKFSLAKKQLAKELVLPLTVIEKSTSKEIASFSTKIEVETKKEVQLVSIQNNHFYKQVGDSIHYEVKILNLGNQPDNVLINNSYTNAIGASIVENRNVELLPFEEKIIRLSKYVDKELMSIDKFSMNISLYNSDGVFSGYTIYTANNVSSNRRFIESNLNYNDNSNYIGLSARNIGTEYSSVNFSAHQKFNIGYNELTYNISANSYSNFNQTTFSNTWIDFKRKDKGITLGNISYGNLELPIYGRGVILYQNLNKNDNEITLGIADNSYNLFEGVNNRYLGKELSVFGRSSYKIKNGTLQSSIIHKQRENLNTFLLSNEYNWISKKEWVNAVKIGYGNLNSNKDNKSENSIAIGVNTSGRVGKYSIYSSNYFSSGYYPGLSRGALVFNERVQREFSKFSIYGAVNYSSYDPKSMEDSFNWGKSNTTNIETGIYFKATERLRMSVNPRFSIQSLGGYSSDNYLVKPRVLQTGYVNTTFYLQSNRRISQLSFNLLGGYYKYKATDIINPVIAGSVNWSYKRFRLSSTLQKGKLGIYQVSSTFKDAINFNTSINYYQEFLNRRLRVDLSGYFNYDKVLGENYTFNVNAEYKLKSRLRIYGSINMNQNKNEFTSNSYVYTQISAQYTFAKSNKIVGKQYGNLNVFVFYDYNGNGVFDEGDKVGDDVVLNINEASFLTSNKGEISYKSIPYGNYRLSIPTDKWYTPNINVQIGSKTTTVAVPLQLSGIVKSKLKLETRSKLEYEVDQNLYGVELIFNNHNGEEFKVKVNNRGEFSTFLPVGEYSFKVNDNTLPDHVYPETYINKVKVEAGQNINYPALHLFIKERRTEVKRFASK